MINDASIVRIERQDITLDGGVPLGGAAGQVLTKSTNSDHDTTWANPSPGVPIGGTAGQLLVKNSNNNYDTIWQDDASIATTADLNALKNEVVYVTGDQIISGKKTFVDDLEIGDVTLDPTLFVADQKVGILNNNPQYPLDVSGLANFSERPTVNTTGVLLSGDQNLIYTSGDQIKSGNLSLSLSNDEVQVDLGFKMSAFVRNAEATDLTKGEVVYVSGAQGDRAAVARASNTAEITAAATFGVAAHTIPAGGDGYIISHG